MNEMELLQTTTDPIDMDMGDPVIEYSPVYPNPEGDPTDDLTKVTIQGNIYKIKDPEVHDWARAGEKPTYTKEEVGLGNVDNTSDENKPISNATQTALDDKVDKVAGKGLSEEDFTHTLKNKLDGIEAGAEVNTVNSVAGKTGNVTLNKSDVGLGNVDNTSDMNKPVSTATQEALQGLASATQTALNGKVDNSTLNNYYTKTETDTALGNKVDKVQGKGLSTNDYDDTAKGIVDGVTTALSGKVDKAEGYGLSENDYSDAEKAKVGEIDNKLDKTETAVNANGLALVTPVNDTAPYTYRQTPVKESFKALMKKIVGASVVWNQLVDSNTTSVTIASGHRYIAKINGTLIFGTSDGTAITVSANDYFTDLTAMFGITIADYVYTLEQATAGSGIAWLQSYGFFTEDYYAYQTNTIESVITSGRKVVGKNLYDRITGFLNGYLSNTGAYTSSSQENANACVVVRCFAGQTYTISKIAGQRFKVACFDHIPSNGDKGTDATYNDTASSLTITPSAGAKYIVAFVWNKNNDEANISMSDMLDSVQIEEGSTATSYEPYTETTYPISPITLRGLFKLSTDKLTVDGDEYNADGSVTRNYGIVDLGTLNWEMTQIGSTGVYRIVSSTLQNIKSATATTSKANIICSKYDTVTASNTYNRIKGISIDLRGYIYVYDENYNTSSSAEAFTTAIGGVYLIYELDTPTTEQTTPYAETMLTGDTEEFIDYGVSQNTRDVAIPVGTDTDYYQEMKLPSLPTTSGNHNLIYNPSTGFGWT